MRRSQKIAATVLLAIALGAGIYSIFGHAPNDSTLGQRVNAAIDDLQAAGVRMLDLPLFMLTAAVLVFAGVGVVLVEKLAFGKRVMQRTVLLTVTVLLLMGVAIVADRRMAKLQRDALADRDRASAVRMTGVGASPEKSPAPVAPANGLSSAAAKIVADVTTTLPAKRRDTYLFDRDAARASLAKYFASPDIQPVIYDSATDVVEVKSSSPLIAAYLAIIDLTLPGVEIKIGGDLNAKTLTSDFAKTTGCAIAINGEAGIAPVFNAGLGTWSGHFMNDGVTRLKEARGNPRPFLSFEKNSHPTFVPMSAASRAVPANAYNVIWGRMDAVVDGVVQTAPERDRQPRTAMAINKEGTKLYLMVVDGRQQRYSIGFTRAEVGQFLKAFGAYNGMLCDEGGSSFMWANGWGIVNYPSDGEERAIYTHFGVVTPK